MIAINLPSLPVSTNDVVPTSGGDQVHSKLVSRRAAPDSGWELPVPQLAGAQVSTLLSSRLVARRLQAPKHLETGDLYCR